MRAHKGISQQKLADAIGVSQQSINKYENYNIEPDIFTLVKLADYFGVSVDAIVGHTANPKSAPLSESEIKLLNNYRLLSPAQRECVEKTIAEFVASANKK